MRTKLVIIKESGQVEEDHQGTHVLLSIEDYTKLIKILEQIAGINRYPNNVSLDLYYPPPEN